MGCSTRFELNGKRSYLSSIETIYRNQRRSHAVIGLFHEMHGIRHRLPKNWVIKARYREPIIA